MCSSFPPKTIRATKECRRWGCEAVQEGKEKQNEGEEHNDKNVLSYKRDH